MAGESELFFLDEVTAFAAGHRPCNHCRKLRYTEFKNAWLRANRPDAGGNTPITEVDKVLHAERAIPGGGKVKFSAAMKDLPSGVIFEHENAAFLVWKGSIHRWSFDEYTPSSVQIGTQSVNVLTPASIVCIYANGFVPGVHASVNSL